ncbi:extracellular solute-binding protein [Chloroflexi bacterium TSY]|nr:extracellular solute-binding protein [Chloroflexi bacterium TSY]
MRTNRKRYLFAVSIMLLALIVSACAPTAPASSDGGAGASGEVIEITVAKSEHPAQPMLQDAPAHLAITEHTGVKINFVALPGDDYRTKRQLWLSTDQVPDLMRATLADIRDFAGDGVIQPLNDLIDEHAPNIKRYVETYPEIQKLTIDGNLYYIPSQYFNWKRLASMPMIRMDIVEELGLEPPTNFDELFDVLAAMKEAYPDAAVWTNRLGTPRLLSLNAYPMGSGWNMYFDKDVDGGKWLYGPIHPEFRDVLDYFARAYAADILDPDFAITTSDQWHEKQSNGKGLYAWENMSFGVRWNLALRENDPEAAWAPLYTLEGAKGARQTQYGGLGSGYVMGANAVDPVATIKMLDWMMTPKGLEVTNWGIEGEHFTRTGDLPETFDDYSIAGIESVLNPANYELLPDVHAEYAEKTDPFRSYQSATGTGLLDFAALTDSAIWYEWDPPGETDEWYVLTNSDAGLHQRTLEPPFSTDEAERIKEIVSNLDSLLLPAYDKVILGQMSLEEYDAAVEQAIEMGAQELEEIYNAAQARLN